MGINRRKPRNASLRFQTFLDSSDVSKKKPERSLLRPRKRSGGRNAYGRITVRHRGGGATRKYRVVDFSRVERDVPGHVRSVEYDPNRNTRIGLVVYENGAKHYMLLPKGIAVGSKIVAGENVEIREGNSLPLRNIPVGFTVHNIEIRPNSGGKIARSAGSAVRIMAKEGDYVTLKMPSGETRLVHRNCWATIGALGNAQYRNISWGKAGRTRHRGFRPTVRGMVMNPVDHPMGGGEAKSKSNKHPVTPWGKPTKGYKTRKRKNPLVIRRKND